MKLTFDEKARLENNGIEFDDYLLTEDFEFLKRWASRKGITIEGKSKVDIVIDLSNLITNNIYDEVVKRQSMD